MTTEKQRLLIVDDEKNIRLTLTHTLEMAGYEIETAINGEDALAQLERATFDLLLLDLRMPGMDGMEVLRHAARQRPDMPVIIITAHGTIENAVAAIRLGAVDFIQKPFSPQEIQTLVAQVLDRVHLDEQQAADYHEHLELAKHSINEHRFDAAAVHARRAIAADTGRPEAFNLLGVLQEAEGDHLSAMRNFRVALDLDPTYLPAQENLMRASEWNRKAERRFTME
jgi:DNA-binding NtrC family response regulator